jgi:hypothetical protein
LMVQGRSAVSYAFATGLMPICTNILYIIGINVCWELKKYKKERRGEIIYSFYKS